MKAKTETETDEINNTIGTLGTEPLLRATKLFCSCVFLFFEFNKEFYFC